MASFGIYAMCVGGGGGVGGGKSEHIKCGAICIIWLLYSYIITFSRV